MPSTLYMVVEHFKNKDAVAVYRRFKESGRMAAEGLMYVSSWVDDKLERCYQLMETHDRRLLDEWMANWSNPPTDTIFRAGLMLGLRRSWSSELIGEGGQRRLKFLGKPRTCRID
jgi:Protein of unknown function (DUF3303)